jgi:AmmeMemoRadiSam system protein A
MAQPAQPPLASWSDTLLGVARRSIEHGLRAGTPLRVDATRYPTPLREPRACFVTLRHGGELRGCVGSLEATRPLVEDVAENAFSAAFRDPRFPPVPREDCPHLELHLSILSPASALSFSSEDDLLATLRPGIDGLILAVDRRRATFLPAVWASLTSPREFLTQLKRKAGLPADYPAEELRAWRYTVEEIA